MIYLIPAIVIAYLIGSIPTAYIFGRIFKGIDIRQHGSGNVGATNVYRTVGKIPGITVFVLDFSKGLVSAGILPALLRKIYPDVPVTPGLAGIFLGTAAIAGHIWTIFLRFKGGKGVATTAGVITGIAPMVTAGWAIIWVAAFSVSRYVSLASIISTIFLPIFALITGQELYFVIFCAVMAIVGVYVHRTNIKRLVMGTENKVSISKSEKKRA
jgi:glycerol-3-phosphate acyltransferase PlsY